MTTDLELSVFQIVGSPLCVASSDGQKIHERLERAMREGRRVVLSFRNVNTLTSAFLNAAIGQLYGRFSEDDVRALLRVKDLEQDDLALLKRVVDTAKQYFQDPRGFEEAVRETPGDATDDA